MDVMEVGIHQTAQSPATGCRSHPLPWLLGPCSHILGAVSSSLSGWQLLLRAKNTDGSQLSLPANICCHKSIQKQDAPLTFNISVLGLLIHYQAVTNVTAMQIRAAALREAVKVPPLPLAQHPSPPTLKQLLISFLSDASLPTIPPSLFLFFQMSEHLFHIHFLAVT